MIPTKEAGREPLGLGRFGTVAGVLVGLAAGVGITVLHATRPASALAPPVASSGANPPPSAVGYADNLSLEQQIARREQLHREGIARHEREPRDPSWSASTERTIMGLLVPLAGTGNFQVSSVDCRTTSCVAYLRVPTYFDAQKAWPSIVQARSDLQCSTEVTLIRPQVTSAPYEFSAVYVCIRPPTAQ